MFISDGEDIMAAVSDITADQRARSTGIWQVWVSSRRSWGTRACIYHFTEEPTLVGETPAGYVYTCSETITKATIRPRTASLPVFVCGPRTPPSFHLGHRRTITVTTNNTPTCRLRAKKVPIMACPRCSDAHWLKGGRSPHFSALPFRP